MLITGGKWPTLSPGVRVGLLAGSGLLLVGAAVLAGRVGPWTGRQQSPQQLPDLPTLTAAPTLPTVTLPSTEPATTSGGGWDPTILLYLLGAALVVLLLLVLGSMLRNRGPAPARVPRPSPAGTPPVATPALPDPDRPFDTREAADYVIACWDELEHRADAIGVGRHREQTPTEFLERLQDGRALDPRAATELLGLYQRARFDSARLAPDTAVRARACSDVLAATLAGSRAAR